MSRDRLYLAHVLTCIERIRRYTAEGRDAFLVDDKTQDAVLRNLHTLAESTQRLSKAAKERRADIPWRAIAGFRNLVVHEYLGVDLGQIWDIVAEDLPVLDEAARQMRDDLEPPGAEPQA